jgi:hypothetical protein
MRKNKLLEVYFMCKTLTFLFLFLAGVFILSAQSINSFGTMEDNGTIAVYSYPGNTKNIIIPERINGLPVTSLTTYPIPSEKEWKEYLDNVKGIETVIIPNTVLEICPGAFSYFVNLKTITIPQSVKSIGSRAFENCYNLQSIVIHNEINIAPAAFIGCDNIDAKVRQDMVNRFGEYIFDDNAPQILIAPYDFTTDELIEKIENMSDEDFFWFLNNF